MQHEESAENNYFWCRARRPQIVEKGEWIHLICIHVKRWNSTPRALRGGSSTRAQAVARTLTTKRTFTCSGTMSSFARPRLFGHLEADGCDEFGTQAAYQSMSRSDLGFG